MRIINVKYVYNYKYIVIMTYVIIKIVEFFCYYIYNSINNI